MGRALQVDYYVHEYLNYAPLDKRQSFDCDHATRNSWNEFSRIFGLSLVKLARNGCAKVV